MSRNRRSCACNMHRRRRSRRAWRMFRQLNTTGERAMRKSILAVTLASTAALGACASNPRVAQDAAIGGIGGAALGAAAGAVIPGVSVLQGAVIGAAVGGLAGAVWADRNNDGVVDGYVYNGQYYAGAPSATAPAPAPMAPAPVRSGERG